MRTYRRRRPYTKRVGLKRKRSYGKRKRIFKRRVKRVIQQTAEKKYVDATSSVYAGGTGAGVFTYIVPSITQGTGVSERVGNQVRGRSLHIRLLIIAGGASTSQTRLKVLIGTWRDYQINTPLSTTLLNNTSVQSISLYNREPLQNKEWTPMFDKDYLMASLNQSNTFPEQKIVDLKFSGKRLPHKLRTFNSSGVAANQYFIYLQTDQPLEPPLIYYQWRYTYTDV